MNIRIVLLFGVFQFGLAGCTSSKNTEAIAAPTAQNKLSLNDKNELKKQSDNYDNEKKYLDAQLTTFSTSDSATLISSQRLIDSVSVILSATNQIINICERHHIENECSGLKAKIDSKERYNSIKKALTEKTELIQDDFKNASANYSSAISTIQDETKNLAKDGITIKDLQPTSIAHSHSVDFLNKKLASVDQAIEAYEEIEKICLQFSSEVVFSQTCFDGNISNLKNKFVALKSSIEQRLQNLDKESHSANFEKEKAEYFKTHMQASVVFAGSYASYAEFSEGQVDISPLIGSYRIENIIEILNKAISEFEARDVKFDPGTATLNKQILAFKEFVKRCQNPAYQGQANQSAILKLMNESNIDLVYSVFIGTDSNMPQFKTRLGIFRVEWFRNFDLSNSTSLATRFNEDFMKMNSAGLVSSAVSDLYEKFEQQLAKYSEKFKFGLGLPFP